MGNRKDPVQRDLLIKEQKHMRVQINDRHEPARFVVVYVTCDTRPFLYSTSYSLDVKLLRHDGLRAESWTFPTSRL